MIVKPKKKSKKLQKDELRIINIDLHAVEEVLLENLMENQLNYFYVNPVDDDLICQMVWDQNSKVLTYVVMPISYVFEGKKLDFDVLQKEVGITSKSLFQADIQKYRTLKITDSIFMDN